MNKIEFEFDYGANTNLTETESQIYIIIKEIADTIDDPRSDLWTSQIKEKIGHLGREKGCDIYSTHHNRELLYDLVWCTKKDNYLESVNLILESELHHRPCHDALKWDFEKLLIGNAENRVMICFNEGSRDQPANMIRAIKCFNDCCKNFKKTEKEIRVLVIIIDDFMNGDVVPHVICI